MRRFTNILFSPLGRHENSLAVRNVAKLVGDQAAHLTMFGVVPAPSGLARHLRPESETDRALREHQCAALHNELASWCTRLGCSSVDIVVETGRPSQAILERVMTEQHDLVVVTSDEDREDSATIRRLLRKCPCPVWVIRPTRARTVRVLAAVNADPDEYELNRLIVELAAGMVALHGGELHIVHAWELYGESTLRSSAFLHVPPAEIDEMVRHERHLRRTALDELLAEPAVRDAPWHVHLVKGDPTEVVPALATRLNINMLVMGTVGRAGVRGLVMGNTAENVLDRVSCSLIAVKPEGFVSPLQP